jgi:outer membrane protein assembly factor BamB
LLISAAGLHAINFADGSRWEYNAVTGVEDYTGTIAANVVGVALGFLTGNFMFASGYNVIHDIVSNAVSDSMYVYYASKNNIVKIDKKNGEVIWNGELPQESTSKSHIIIEDSILYHVNYGYAYMGNRKLKFGKPYIAAYNVETGKQKYLSQLENQEMINSYYISDKNMFLLTDKDILMYSKETGRFISKKKCADTIGNLQYFIGSRVYMNDANNHFFPVIQQDTSKLFILTKNEYFLTVDSMLNITDTQKTNNWYIYYARYNDKKFIAKGQETIIINEDGNEIAEITATLNAFLIDKVLYDKKNNIFTKIDLTELLNNSDNQLYVE